MINETPPCGDQSCLLFLSHSLERENPDAANRSWLILDPHFHGDDDRS